MTVGDAVGANDVRVGDNVTGSSHSNVHVERSYTAEAWHAHMLEAGQRFCFQQLTACG